MRGRAYRREAEAKRKAWAARTFGEPDERMIGILATTPCICSGWMCRAERDMFELTRQEQRARDSERDEMKGAT